MCFGDFLGKSTLRDSYHKENASHYHLAEYDYRPNWTTRSQITN